MYVWDDKKKQYVSDTPASRIPVKDSAELFDSNNVEGALAELAGERDAQSITIQDHTGKIKNLSEAVDWLKANGGGGGGTGGGGTVMPTITTTDELSQVVPKGQEIVLNVFFSSPNLGQGSLVLLVNNKEVNSFTIKQGSNSINIGALKDLRNKIVIYAKDRANLVSNEITYNIINGGVSLTLDFDYYADYPADKDVLMRYNIDTDQEDVQLEVTVDNKKSSVACKNGYNEYYFKNLTVGIHAVTVKAVSGQFISETYSFNLVIINSDSLYISSTFGENPKCTLGVPVVIDYRISYKDDTAITLVLTLDGKVNKTLTSKRGSYAWTLNDMTLGSHSYKIDCTLGADTASLEGTFVVEAGDYTPLQINRDGLRYQMGCANRTNQDDDKEEFIYDNGTSQITTRLKGFNFETNGWIDGALICNGGAYAEIDYACMEDNAPYSLTVEVDFKATDIGLPNARVLECRDANTKKGFHVALNEAKLNSTAQEARVYITPEERTTVTLQIDRQSKFAKIYVNGIITSAFYLTDSGSGTSTVLENFAHKGKIYVGCDKDLGNIGNCEIYDIRVYARRVSNDDIVKNVIAQEKDLRKQEDSYNFCFNNNTLSTMRLYSDEVENKVSNMTNTNKITMRAVYRSTNTEKYGQPFELKYCKVYWQGTSSLDYIRKNYNLELYDDDLQEFYYSPYPNSVQEYLFCLKCDYMESSHARNVGIGNLINKYWYTSKNPAQLKDDMVQNAIQGFPMLLYINDEFMGVYNFNTDRYSNASFGYTGDECLAYEVSANSDTTAGAFITYDKTKHEGNEIDYYKTDFMCLYPPTRRAGNDTMDEIKALVTFVDKSSDEEFITNINNNLYFNKEYLLRYLIYCLIMGAVDSLGKNMKLATWDGGKTWYPQIYDCDTTMGLDNSGMLFYDTNIKIQAGVYNTSNSRLWSRLMELMWADIQAEYTKMRNTTLTLENLYECIITNQMDCIPATYYNSDCETKYLQFKASFLDALHGQGKQQVTEWLRARLLYIDTYMEYWTTTSDFVSLRSAKEGTVYIDLEMFDNMFVQIKWRNTGEASDNTAIQIQEVKKGEVMRFSFESKAKTDQEIRVFGGKYVKSLGDLSNLSPVRVNITSATRLTDLVCHSDTLKTVELSTCTNLQKVDLKDCTILGSSDQSTKLLNVSGCTNIQYINLLNTQIQGVNLNPKGSNIQEIWYPKDIQSIVLANCPHLTTVGLQYGHSCKELSLTNCPKVEAFGDRQWDSGTATYKYDNAYFLGSIQSIMLNGSYDVPILEMWFSYGITDIELKNMQNMEAVHIGYNYLKGNPSSNKITGETIANAKDFTLHSTNCPKLKKFKVLHNYCKDYSYEPRRVNKSDNFYLLGFFGHQYSGAVYNKIDLSQTNITEVNFYIPVLTNLLKIPTTVKNLIINPFLNLEDSLLLKEDSRYAPKWNQYVSLFANYCPFDTHNFIRNIVTDKSGELTDLTGSIYDLKGCVLDNFHLWDNDLSLVSGLTTTLQNCEIHSKKEAMCFKNITCGDNVTLDLSQYTGECFKYGLSGVTESTNLTLPTTWDNLKYLDFALDGITCSKIKWTDDIVAKCFSYTEDVLSQFRNITLAEQKEGDPRPNFENSNRTSWNSNYDWILFKGCNLKYIGTLSFPNTEALISVFTTSCQVEEVDEILVPKAKSLYNCLRKSNLRKLGRLYSEQEITNMGSFASWNDTIEEIGKLDFTINASLAQAFQNCSKLKKIKLKGRTTDMNNICNSASGLQELDLSELYSDSPINFKNAFTGAFVEGTEITFNNLSFTDCTSTFKNSKCTKVIFNNCNFDSVTTFTEMFMVSQVETIMGLSDSKLAQVSWASCFARDSKLKNVNSDNGVVLKFNKSLSRNATSLFSQATEVEIANVDMTEVTYGSVCSVFWNTTSSTSLKIGLPYELYKSSPKDIEDNRSTVLGGLTYQCINLENIEFVLPGSISELSFTEGINGSGMPLSLAGKNKRDKLTITNYPVNIIRNRPVWEGNLYIKHISFQGLAQTYSEFSCMIMPYECMIDLVTNHLNTEEGKTGSLLFHTYKYLYNSEFKTYAQLLTDEEKSNIESIVAEKGWTVQFLRPYTV